MTGNRSKPESPTACRRCGICCQKGGPTLQKEDRPLVERGKLPLKLLVTIRKGEIVRDPKSGSLMRTEEEMIKLKGSGADWCCILFDAVQDRCTRYEYRPVQCRAMACWDTAEIERVMKAPRLNREDLLSGIEGLWALVKDHARRCGLGVAGELSGAAGRGQEKAGARLMEMLRYDRALRELLQERGTDSEQLDFLLGRPLDRLLEGFGMRLVSNGGRVEVRGIDPASSADAR